MIDQEQELDQKAQEELTALFATRLIGSRWRKVRSISLGADHIFPVGTVVTITGHDGDFHTIREAGPRSNVLAGLHENWERID